MTAQNFRNMIKEYGESLDEALKLGVKLSCGNSGIKVFSPKNGFFEISEDGAKKFADFLQKVKDGEYDKILRISVEPAKIIIRESALPPRP